MNAVGTSALNDADGWSFKSIFRFIKKIKLYKAFMWRICAGNLTTKRSVPLIPPNVEKFIATDVEEIKIGIELEIFVQN